MVALDISGSGFTAGERILPDDCGKPSLDPHSLIPSALSGEPSLIRHGTLLTVGASSVRNAAELKSILGNSSARLKAGAIVPPSSTRTSQVDKTSLEQAKPRARVEVDIILDSKTCVEGGHLRGKVKIRIRKRALKESVVLMSGGKIRVIGFEYGRDDRHTFYQVSTLLSDVSDDHTVMYDSPPDTEGFYLAKEGSYVFPFTMELPLDGDSGVPKGVLHSHSVLTVRYIAMFSIKVKERETGKRSIAHFYRDCEIWPRLNPSVVLAPSPTPIRNTTSKGLFMGGNGQITLSASIHRLHWVAGQYCCVKAHVTNYTKKTIKSLTLSLSRSTVFFKPRPYLEVDCQQEDNDPDACQTSTTDRQVAESTLQMGQRGARGHASAKGWWTGVQPGETQEFSHFLLLPPDALTMPRGRLLEVEYEIRVSVSAGPFGSDVSVSLPIKIINFLSIDPPPSSPFPLTDSVPSQRDTTRDSEAYMIGTCFSHSKSRTKSSRMNIQMDCPPKEVTEISAWTSTKHTMEYATPSRV
ncbi:E set domain-containing protein [Hymenopellis radicata]|nr:E set domain-containing protein [Hymenopellis radicata]